MEQIDIKKHFPLLIETELINQIQQVGKIQEFNADETIMQVDSYIKYVPLILKGSVKVIREDENGNEILLYYLVGGESCAMTITCCLSTKKSKIKAITEEKSTLLFIPISYIDEWMTKYSSWRNFILTTYSMRFDFLLEAIDTIAFHNMEERIMKYLLQKLEATGTKKFHITHQTIAFELNTSREVVSRILKKLEMINEIKLSRNQIELI